MPEKNWSASPRIRLDLTHTICVVGPHVPERPMIQHKSSPDSIRCIFTPIFFTQYEFYYWKPQVPRRKVCQCVLTSYQGQQKDSCQHQCGRYNVSLGSPCLQIAYCASETVWRSSLHHLHRARQVHPSRRTYLRPTKATRSASAG